MAVSDEVKDRARAVARARRREAALACPDAGARIAAHFLPLMERLGLQGNAVVAGYKPMGAEADVWPLMERLDGMGGKCALPVVSSRSTPLTFRRWRRGDALTAGLHGTEQPSADQPAAVPDVVLVPLLAFDDAGYRLGQGGGYYDRTLAGLRREKRIVAVGVALQAQRLDAVPRSAHDERLDGLVTETGARLFD